MANEYGEPWMETDGAVVSSDKQLSQVDQMKRAVNCVNLLAGIPDEELPNVLKCWITLHPNNTGETLDKWLRGCIDNRDGIYEQKLALLDNLKNVSGK